MAEFAVRYTQPLLGAANAAGYLVAVPGVSVLIRQDGVECDVFADNTKTPMDNPVPTGVPPGTAGVDTTGNLTVYLEPGRGYSAVATVGATSTTFAIPDISLDPLEPIPADAVEEAMLAFDVATQTELTSAISGLSGTYVGMVTGLVAGGANNAATLIAALDAAPEGATLLVPGAASSYYLEAALVSGPGFAAVKPTKNVRLVGVGGYKPKFKIGPENPTTPLIGFYQAAGKRISLSNIDVEGPTAPNGQTVQGVSAAEGVGGAIILERDVSVTKCATCVKAEGDVPTVASNTHISIGPGCLIKSNGLGQGVLHNGGTFDSHREATFDSDPGGSSLDHNLYLAPHVAADIDGTFLHTGGYNVHPFGTSSRRPAYFIIRGKFLGTPGTAAVLGHPLALTQVVGSAVFANTTGSGIITQADTIVSDGVSFLTPNAAIEGVAAASPHVVRLNDVRCYSRVRASIAGVTWEVRGGTYDPADNFDPFLVNLAGAILDIDGARIESGGTNAELIRVSAGTARVSRTFLNNAARPTTLFSATAAFTQADVGAAVTVTGVGAAGATLSTTISKVISSKKAILAAAASTVQTGIATITIAGAQRATDGTMDTRSPRGIYATGAGTVVEGDSNRWAVVAGRGWLSDANATGKLTAKRGIGTAVASAASLVLDPNFDTFHVTGTVSITNIYVDIATADVQRLHSYRVHLIADAAWATSAAGNITPKTAAARVAGQMVVLQYDPATVKWYEAA